MGTPELSSYDRMVMPEVLSRSAGPQEVTAGGSRQTFDTLCESPTIDRQQFIHCISRLTERLALLEKEQGQRRVWSESVDSRLQFLERWCSQHAESDHYKPQQTHNPDPPYQEGHRRHEEAFPGGESQKELQENEELKKLKEENKELERRFQKLLSKVMGMHEKSENINDPLRLSAVLKMYEMLRLHDWEKFRSSSPYLTYETGRSIIEKLFEACEKDIQQRTAKIFKVIGIPPSNDAMTNSKQGLMQAIRSVLRYSYYENDCEFYNKIVMLSSFRSSRIQGYMATLYQS
ncbi:uncharacterized protein LOC135985350 [Caloenas nicobarica]|uniref:uncharacterized protein LOC135985350 n=1 Tax=Caloenas nicobarica TaxID=187106 RepID=UPI0032B85C69